MSPEWTNSGIFQATSRGIRAKAHTDLERVLRQREGKMDKDEEVEIEVKIYLHTAISKHNNSIDRNMYFTVERKNEGIQKVITMAKRVAVNCQLDYDKNVRLDDDVTSRYIPYDSWASSSDESSYKLYMYHTIANYVKENILHNIHSSHGQHQSERKRQSQSQTNSQSAALMTRSAIASKEGVQTLEEIMSRFGSLYQSESMAFAIQWKLRDKVHCMDIYARPGSMDISMGLVYYSTCAGVKSPNYSDIIIGVRTVSVMELISISQEKYYSLITGSLDPRHMKVNTFARLLKSNKTSTVGSIHLIEAIIQIAVELFGVDSVELWNSIERAESHSQSGSPSAMSQEGFSPTQKAFSSSVSCSLSSMSWRG